MNNTRAWVWAVSTVIAVLVMTSEAAANPVWGKRLDLRQPDGSLVPVRIWGDEYYQDVESLDGYTLVRDPGTHEIRYAILSPDGTQLVPTAYSASHSLPAGFSIALHIRIDQKTKMAAINRARTRSATADLQARKALGMPPKATPPCTGDVKGICLLVDFSDEPGTILPSAVNDHLNQIGCTAYANNGSTYDYFYDVSGGILRYTNYVPTAYYRALHPKSYYDNPVDGGPRKAQELIVEALNWLDGQGFDFSQCDSNSDGIVDAINCYYAGYCSCGWAEGLWPHSGSVTFTRDGVSTYRYQISYMGNSLTLGTFCHENGHMLAGWPDLYDYGSDSAGVGNFCLMCAGASDQNPVQPCCYLKMMANWATVTDLVTPQSGLSVTSTTNAFYRFTHPTLPNEFYLIENRQATGRDSNLPDSGLAIWHVDTNGSNDNQSQTPSSHYMVTLVQADGRWDLERFGNNGDAADLFDAAEDKPCGPSTDPNTNWWAGDASGLLIHTISASAPTMTFSSGAMAPMLWCTANKLEQACDEGHDVASQTFTVLNMGTGTVNYTITDDASWLFVNPASGSSTGEHDVVTVNYATAGLAFGTYTATITVAATGATYSPRTISVSLMVRADGSIVAWGNGEEGQCDVPSPNAGFVTMAAGAWHSLGLKSDGSVVAWGNNYSGQCDVPSPNASFVAVAVGASHSLGLKSDGSVVAWGSDDEDQCSIPTSNTGFVAVAAGMHHSLGLRYDGTVVAWGDNGRGQCDIPTPNAGFVAVTTSGGHCLALKADGSLVAWGKNADGQCVVPSPNADFTAMAAGVWHSLGLKSNGTVVGWGFNGYGRCDVPSPNAGFVAVAAGDYHSLGLKSDGSLVTWGGNGHGQCDIPCLNTRFAAVAVGGECNLALSRVPASPIIRQHPFSQSVLEGGSVVFVVGGVGTVPLSYQWRMNGTPISGATRPAYSIATVPLSSPASNYDCVVSNSVGDATSNAATLTVTAAPVIGFSPSSLTPSCIEGQTASSSPVDVWNSGSNTLAYAITDDVAWLAVSPESGTSTGEHDPLTVTYDTSGLSGGTYVGTITIAAPGAGNTPQTIAVTLTVNHTTPPTPDPMTWASPPSTSSTNCISMTATTATDPTGVEYYFHETTGHAGATDSGWQDSPTYTDFGLRAHVQYTYQVKARDKSAHHNETAYSVTASATASDGCVITWGGDDCAECSVPYPNTGFVAVAGGWNHSLGLKLDGSAVAWGSNYYVQGEIPSPNADFVALAEGRFHCLGLKSHGSVVAWGNDAEGQCTVPSPNAGFVAASTGWAHSLGLKSDGSVVAWGNNAYGQCTVPSPNAGFVAVAAGWNHSLGLKADGSVVAWGNNENGQCAPPSPNTGFVAVAGGWTHSLGLKSDGSVVAWGNNDNGQCTVPSPNTGFVALDAGAAHSLGLKSDGSVVAWGNNDDGQCNVPYLNAHFVAVEAGDRHSLAVSLEPAGPLVYQHPLSRSVLEGGGVLFVVRSVGAVPLSYQWRLGGAAIPGATQSTYSIAAAQPSNGGRYDCVVSNSVGSATSHVAVLSVNDPDAPLQANFYIANAWGSPPHEVTFIDASTPGTSPIFDWAWDFGDGQTLSGEEPNPTHVYEHAGVYTVSLTVTTLIGSSTKTFTDVIVVSEQLPLAGWGLLAAAAILGVLAQRYRKVRD